MTAFSAIPAIVGNRTLAVVCQGPSAPFVSTVARKDWCYASINRASLIEPLCPGPLEIVYCSSAPRIRQELPWLEEFKGLLISVEEADGTLTRPFLSDDTNPAHGPLNTLSAFLLCLMKSGVKDIVIFGCDGTGGTYYRKEHYGKHEFNQSVHDDSKMMNKRFWEVARAYAREWVGSITLAHPQKKSEVNCFPIMDLAGLKARKPI